MIWVRGIEPKEKFKVISYKSKNVKPQEPWKTKVYLASRENIELKTYNFKLLFLAGSSILAMAGFEQIWHFLLDQMQTYTNYPLSY